MLRRACFAGDFSLDIRRRMTQRFGAVVRRGPFRVRPDGQSQPWRKFMRALKLALPVILLASSVMVVAARADSDDVKWVAQCLKDNQAAKVSVEVINKYCTCMNNKMSSNETQSITQWEKTHKTEREACDTEAGWK
jgi:hypothetical protein